MEGMGGEGKMEGEREEQEVVKREDGERKGRG